MRNGILMLVLALAVVAFSGTAWAAEEPQAKDGEVVAAATQAELEAEIFTADEPAACEATGLVQSEEIDLGTAQSAGQQCGGVVCGKFLYCCNPTCNRCVPFGWGCTQEVCN